MTVDVSPTQPPTISHQEIKDRQQRVLARATERGYDAVLVIGRSFYDRPGDLAYLSNHFPPFPSTVFAGDYRGFGHALLLLRSTGDVTLITDPRRQRADIVPIEDVRPVTDFGAAAVDLINEFNLDRGTIALVGDDLLPTALWREWTAALPHVTFRIDNELVSALRRIKSPAEQHLLRQAARCADAGLTAAVSTTQESSVTERDVCAAGTFAALKQGADFVRYFRVHSGTWSAAGSRWPQAMDRTIAPQEIVALDAIGAFGGYAFDVNRTTVAGSPTDDHRALVETVLEATQVAVDACLPGATTGDVYQAAQQVIESTRFAENFGGMAGHGIGLETVELPYVRAGGTDLLEPGMVLCIEPGIFVPGWSGASIEQEVIIQPDGAPEVITPTAMQLW